MSMVITLSDEFEVSTLEIPDKVFISTIQFVKFGLL